MKTQTKLVGLKPTLLMAQMKADFTKSDIKIYEYILANKEKVLYHSLTEMAEACVVAEATLLRFFRKLDYKGFQDFKFMLAQELSLTTIDAVENTYVDKVKNNVIQVITDTAAVVEEDLLDQAIMKIAASEDLVIFGIGSSGIAALDMQNRLMRIGKNSSIITDSHFQMMRAASMTEKTVVIAVSLTGSTKDIVDAVSASKSNGATVIALTSYTKSPLTKFADLVLLSSSKESPLDSGSLISKISQLFLIDLICTGLALKNEQEAKVIQLKISENTANKLY
ncbi:MurR/RpiR family transcriptional regulator [Planococcus faecalis]|uniref:RpiR family transcriptional regulator n=1 Tax=Planococcus faecalis TaxID=1598147 RepID=A0ABN4XPK4_9BACL|nr:MurR/RpiR family transcriptional regulator [Planococcus faecalis]AQU80715.1 RpiR family transcriptional regulator [Planococcus faecalis]OHX55708.1 RpiR family transcriptional regulator [Planococcus faecalis]